MNLHWMQNALSGSSDVHESDNALENSQSEPTKRYKGKTLRIIVRSAENDKVNIKLPIGLGLSILRHGSKSISINNKAFDQLDLDELQSLIDEGVIGEIVNVESHEGDIVKIVID